MTRKLSSPLNAWPFLWLMAPVFVVALGYGFALPVLLFFLERLLEDSGRFSVSLHIEMITGVYAFAMFLFAPPWGRFPDMSAASHDSRLVNVQLTFLKAFGLGGYEVEPPWHRQQILDLGANRRSQMYLKTE